MRFVIYDRNEREFEQEYIAAGKHFIRERSRTRFQKKDLIIPRYSALPFYRELENDCVLQGAKLINSYDQHLYCADLVNYSSDLKWCTPKLYENLYELPENGKFVLKGETNSRKFHWNTHMFADSKKSAIKVHSLLCEDGLIGSQKICIREFVPLETFLISEKGLPITREYRFFIHKNTIISGGFYWSNFYDDIIESGIKLSTEEVPKVFLEKVISCVQSAFYAPNFYVIDAAKTESGEWIVIELNDGCMSGLSENNPDTLYGNLRSALEYDDV